MPNLIPQHGNRGHLLRDIFSEHHAAGAVHGTMANDRVNARTVVDKYATTQMVLNPGFETSGTNGGLVSGTRTVNRARTTGVATLEATAHGLVNGNVATIASMTDATYNAASVVVTRIDNDHFTYVNAGLDEVETADAAGVITTAVFANWTLDVGPGGLVAREMVDIHGGSAAVKLTRVTYAANAAQNITVIPGLSYTFVCWTHGDGVSDGRYGLRDVTHGYTFLTSTGTWVNTGVAGAVYAQVGETVTIPAGCTSVEVSVRAQTGVANVVYFDDISLLPTTGLLQISNLWDALGLQNRVYNGGFETAGAGGADVFAGWTETAGDGAIARTLVAGEFRSGVAAAKLTSGATSNTNIYSTGVPQVIPGIEYTATIWTRGDGVNAGRYQIYDATNSANIIATTSTGITAAVYGSVVVNFIAPVGCVLVRVYCHCPAANGGWACFDDISVVQATVSAERQLVLLGKKAVSAYGDPAFWESAQTRVAGKAVIFKNLRLNDYSLALFIGWDNNLTGIAEANSIRFGGGFDITLDNAVNNPSVGVSSAGPWDFAVFLRTSGGMYLRRTTGDQTWTLLWISTGSISASVYPSIGTFTASGTLGQMLIPSTLFLPMPLASDGFGRADGALGNSDGAGHSEGVAGSLGNGGSGMAWTNQIGTTLISANTAIPNALVGGVAIATIASTQPKVILTAKLWRAAGNPGLVLSYSDSDNYLRAVRTAANTQLIQRVAGVEATLITVAQAYAAGSELRVVLDGAYCAVYYNNALAGSTAVIPAALQVSSAHGLWADDVTAGNAWDDLTIYARSGYEVPS